MSQTLLGVDGPIGWTDHYTTRRGVRGSNTIFKPDAIVAVDLSVPRFYKLVVRNGSSRPFVATGSFHAMWELWKHLGLKGPMREKSDADVVSAALAVTLGSRSVFCIELLNDYLYTAGLVKADPYQYRINKPGTVARTLWV